MTCTYTQHSSSFLGNSVDVHPTTYLLKHLGKNRVHRLSQTNRTLTLGPVVHLVYPGVQYCRAHLGPTIEETLVKIAPVANYALPRFPTTAALDLPSDMQQVG